MPTSIQHIPQALSRRQVNSKSRCKSGQMRLLFNPVLVPEVPCARKDHRQPQVIRDSHNGLISD